jgi:hypothetical protein
MEREREREREREGGREIKRKGRGIQQYHLFISWGHVKNDN